MFRLGTRIIPSRLLTTTSVNNIVQKWRQERGLPLNPNAHGPLTDKPDYTFLDGRPTPLGIKQNKRYIKQKEYAKKVIQLSKEIDHAVERHSQILSQKEEDKKKILANKLKPKGHLLLKNDKS